MRKIIVPIRGMHCKSCEMLIEEQVMKIPEVSKVSVNHMLGKAKVFYENKAPKQEELAQAISEAGYEMGRADKLPWITRSGQHYRQLFLAAAILFFLYIVVKGSGLGDIAINVGSKSIMMSLVVGLAAGFSSCMALIGGLVLGLSARHSELHPEASRSQKFRPHIFFNMGRIIGFAVFGGAIGLLGGFLQPSARILAILTLVVGLVMIFLGLKLIEIFPALQNKSITLPKFISKWLGIKRENKEYSHRGAFISGALSFFLPCGFTQAMQLFAISTGSFVQGAIIMALFAVGTAPGLLGIGGLSSAFKGRAAKQFFATAGLAVILLGGYNITNASRIVFPPQNASVESTAETIPSGPAQIVSATYNIDQGLQPKSFTANVNQLVRFEIDVKEEDPGCMGSIMIPGLFKKPQFMKEGSKTVMEFTPTKSGTYTITCAMGLPHGTIKIN